MSKFMKEDSEWRIKYDVYMRSPMWWKKRSQAIYFANNRCGRCRWQSLDGVGLEVHHKTYVNLGKEPLDDLEVLCKSCHKKADSQREAESLQRATQALEKARFRGWAETVDPDNLEDEDVLYERYEAWLEWRGER